MNLTRASRPRFTNGTSCCGSSSATLRCPFKTRATARSAPRSLASSRAVSSMLRPRPPVRRPRRAGTASYSPSFFVPRPTTWKAKWSTSAYRKSSGRRARYLVATLSLSRILESAEVAPFLRAYEVSFIEGGERLARSGPSRGRGVFTADRIVSLPGHALQLRVDSTSGRPHLIPTWQLHWCSACRCYCSPSCWRWRATSASARDAENALAESLALRQAIEDSTITGLKACDFDGRHHLRQPGFLSTDRIRADALIGHERRSIGRSADPAARSASCAHRCHGFSTRRTRSARSGVCPS